MSTTAPTAAVAAQIRAVATIQHERGVAAATVRQMSAVATAVAAQGPAGPPGQNAAAPYSYAISGVASFTASHGLPFAPEAWVITPEGELVETDVLHSPGATTVVFPQPFTGLLYLR